MTNFPTDPTSIGIAIDKLISERDAAVAQVDVLRAALKNAISHLRDYGRKTDECFVVLITELERALAPVETAAPKQYIIVKSSRDTTIPYDGPSCAPAGVEAGKIYNDKAEAQADALKLNAINPVGFWVYPYNNESY